MRLVHYDTYKHSGIQEINSNNDLFRRLRISRRASFNHEELEKARVKKALDSRETTIISPL